MLCKLGHIEQAERVFSENQHFFSDSPVPTVLFCKGFIADARGQYSLMRTSWSSMSNPTGYQKNIAAILDCYARYRESYKSQNWLAGGASGIKDTHRNLQKRLNNEPEASHSKQDPLFPVISGRCTGLDRHPATNQPDPSIEWKGLADE